MEQATVRNDQSWDLEADVVIIGSGAAGLPAAIKAVEGGASVIVVETNYDVGGHAIISGGHMALGGGTSAQKKYGIPDSPDTVFSDLTDWSIIQPNGWPDFRYNDRAVMRAFADHCALVYEFLLANGVEFTDKTPDNHGASTTGNSAPRENHAVWSKGAGLESPNAANGTSVIRPLEASARAKGVRFLLNYKMTSLIREPSAEQKTGRVIGITVAVHSENHARRNDTAEKLSLGWEHRKHEADDEPPRDQSGYHRHRRQYQQRKLSPYVRPADDGSDPSRG